MNAVAQVDERILLLLDDYHLISEPQIHDATSPFAPRGCPAQAWSVAEVLRVLTLLK